MKQKFEWDVKIHQSTKFFMIILRPINQAQPTE